MIDKTTYLTQRPAVRQLFILVGLGLILTGCKQSTNQQDQSNQASATPIATPTPAPTPSPTPPPTTLMSPGGIEITDIQWGVGTPPPPGATVAFRYTVYDATGERIDSTDGLPQPVEVRWDDPGAGTFPVWGELLAPLPAGSKAMARVPAAKAFGERGYRDVIAPNADLVIEWEVIAITAPENAPPAAAPPNP